MADTRQDDRQRQKHLMLLVGIAFLVAIGWQILSGGRSAISFHTGKTALPSQDRRAPARQSSTGTSQGSKRSQTLMPAPRQTAERAALSTTAPGRTAPLAVISRLSTPASRTSSSSRQTTASMPSTTRMRRQRRNLPGLCRILPRRNRLEDPFATRIPVRCLISDPLHAKAPRGRLTSRGELSAALIPCCRHAPALGLLDPSGSHFFSNVSATPARSSRIGRCCGQTLSQPPHLMQSPAFPWPTVRTEL